MEDNRIVQLYWERNPSAINETANKYGNYCTSIAKNILRNVEEVEECVNDTYLKAWNAIPPHKPSMLSTFLGKITRNLAFNKYKYNHADKRCGNEFVIILGELNECVSGNDNVEEEIEYKELVNIINSFLGNLSKEQRSIFVCRYWYGDSISQIAKQFQMKENTVSMTLNRIRKRLKMYLSERGYHV